MSHASGDSAWRGVVFERHSRVNAAFGIGDRIHISRF